MRRLLILIIAGQMMQIVWVAILTVAFSGPIDTGIETLTLITIAAAIYAVGDFAKLAIKASS